MHRLKEIPSFLRRKLGYAAPLIPYQMLDREYIVRKGHFRSKPDYDDAWLLSCARHTEIVFDVGANIGQTAFVILLSDKVKKLVLVEPNPEALTASAEHLVRNHLSARVNLVCALAAEAHDQTVQFWTTGIAAASSIYADQAGTAKKKNSFIRVPTTSIDYLCDFYGVVPDLVKIDVEGAECKVLSGSTRCASYAKTRFLVELHPTPVSVAENAREVIRWSETVGYRTWYLKEHVALDDSKQVQHRGRCHVLLQPASWSYPTWLKGIQQSDGLTKALAADVTDSSQS